MADEAYVLQVDGDITALGAKIEQTMTKLSTTVSDLQTEQLRAATVIEKEKLAGVNKLAALELKAVKDAEMEKLRSINRVMLAQTRASLRGTTGGAGNTANKSFMTSLLGTENASADTAKKIRVVSAEFLKMATFSRVATLALNAFKGASSFLVGGLIGSAVFALAGGLRMIGDKFMEARSEAKKFREEHEKLNKELTKSAILLGTPKAFLGSLSGLDNNQKMLEELAKKGFVGVSGLQKFGDEFGGKTRKDTATNAVYNGVSEDSARAFATLWEVTRGRVKEFGDIVKLSERQIVEDMQFDKNNMRPGGVATDTNASLNNAIRAAQGKVTDFAAKLSEAKWFDWQVLAVAAENFKENQKDAAKKIKEKKDHILKGLIDEFATAFNAQGAKAKDFNKWLKEQNDPAKNKQGVDNPADTFFTIQKSMTDYAMSFKLQKDAIVERLDMLVKGDDKLYVLWQQIQQY